MKRKLLVALLTAAMAVSLTACGKGNAGSGSNDAGNTASDAGGG